ncbi:hypothetical protein M2350_001658 [Candidatus Fervidibacter sacchari]|uniref:Uncharacterized protein n=1 Tax=Candidatus Fervidibacter sacchari TaxID=1448929 RepID=A0ABT2EN20_9BACT|nr:hypothetical protein [Candidatus Fervidibacter sacchari]
MSTDLERDKGRKGNGTMDAGQEILENGSEW